MRPLVGRADAASLLAAAIAERAHPNFLVAGLISRAHGLHDTSPATPEALASEATLGAALAEYIDRVPSDAVDVRQALTTLAFAEPPGFTPGLWSTAVEALHGDPVAPGPCSTSPGRQRRASSSTTPRPAAGASGFHQALNDTLFAARSVREGGPDGATPTATSCATSRPTPSGPARAPSTTSSPTTGTCSTPTCDASGASPGTGRAASGAAAG